MNTKEKIILTAFKQFLKSNYHDVSINKIVKEIGITKGGFYYYFGSKEELLIEVIEKYCFNYFDDFQALISAPDRSLSEKFQQTAAMMVDLVDFCREEGVEFRSFLLVLYETMKQFGYMRQKIIMLYRLSFKQLVQVLQSEQQNGVINSSVDIEAVALQYMVLMEGILFMSEIFEPEMLKDNIYKMFDNLWYVIENGHQKKTVTTSGSEI